MQIRSSNPEERPTRKRWGRALVFRLAAVLLGLMPFLVAETALTLLDWGQPEYVDDPFVGFRSVRPLFVINEAGTEYEIAPSRLGFFRPDAFEVQKSADEFRIFCLGGSTVQGRPFAVETSFTTWLEISLQQADPSRSWEVVNCGGVSYASYRLVPVLEEVLGHEPDLIILYTGHNEFLEDRTYRHIKHLPAPLAWPCRMVARTRTFSLVSQGLRRVRGGSPGDAPRDRPVLESEVDAMLEYQGGLAQYHRDDRWRRDTIEHYRYNLQRMVQMTRSAGVPLVLVNPVSNLRDCAPFKTEHREGLTAEDLARWESLIEEAGRCQDADMERAVALLEEALTIDDEHAGLHYILAKCYDVEGRVVEAREAYVRSKELDICPLRILEPMNEAVLDTARRGEVILADVRKLYESRTESGIPGGFLLVDHIHPSIAGHQMIANLLADTLVQHGFVEPEPAWRSRRDRGYREHLASLDELYFLKGQQRLEMLQCWTQGKASAVRKKPNTTAGKGSP